MRSIGRRTNPARLLGCADKKKDKIAHTFVTGVNVPVPGEKDSWEAITNKLFEQQLGKDDDEGFWALPEAGKIGQKSGGV